MKRSFITLTLLLSLFLPLSAQTIEGEQAGTSATSFTAGLQAEQAGDAAKAIGQLTIAAEDKSFPLSDYARYEIATLFYQAKDFPAAAREFQLLSVGYPQSLLVPKALFWLGKSHYNNDDYAAAAKTLNVLLDKYPDFDEVAEARFLIAQSHEKNGDWKNAYYAYEETDLYHPLSSYGQRSRAAIAKLKKQHKKKLPLYKASEKALFNQGMAYFDQQDYKMAGNIFNRLAREYPKSKFVDEAWIMLGRAEALDNDLDKAVVNLNRAAQNSPSLAGKANYYLGRAYGNRGKYDWGVAAFSKVINNHPESSYAPDALYWRGYFREQLGDINGGLNDYYALVKNYPYCDMVSAAIWRMGKIYYWASDWPNAVTYLHLAQLYPMGSESPRCYFFEAKALERQGNLGAAQEVYKKLAKRYDHTYYAYRAKERLRLTGNPINDEVAFDLDNLNEALKTIDEKDQAELGVLMDIWLQSKPAEGTTISQAELDFHFQKYKKLMDLGQTAFAAEEAKFLVNGTSDLEKESAQLKLGEVLVRAGRYISAIRFAQRKIDAALYSDQLESVPEKVWQLAYPRGYWSTVRKESDKNDIDPYLILAVIREESRFLNAARSSASARGLMQIMPGTGRGIAKQLNLSSYRTSKLNNADTNIKMGTYYLSGLIKSFNNNWYLSLAGYNGGPNRVWRYVKNWYGGNLGAVDIDEFVESIPIKETRLYVQKVMNSYFEYKRLYGGTGS